MADHKFYDPGEIDLLIGSDLFWDILGNGRVSLGKGKPVLQETAFGWIVAGPYDYKTSNVSNRSLSCNFCVNNDIQDQLSKFWELEKVSPDKLMSVKEQACEKYFNETTTRDDCGRFVVSLLFKDTSELLGDSLTMTKNRFLSLERKLAKNKKLKTLYFDL